jgi:hypothetical protein
MSLHSINPRIYIIIAVGFLFLFAGFAAASDVNNAGGRPPAEINDTNGPTVTLSYTNQPAAKNLFASFMYFVPLVSKTLVDVETSADNRQMIGTVSYERKINPKSFYAVSEFEMTGSGFHKYIFDPQEVIAAHIGELKKGETLSHMIDYIKFDGAGFGRIEVKGTISDSVKTVTEVTLRFNARGQKSPVTIGLYNVKPVNGKYSYENRTGELVARVDTFVFKKSQGWPTLGIKLSSIDTASKPDGFFAGIKGAIANLFINPPKISKIGNDTMLCFGSSLLNEQPSFTFPRAENIRETRIVTKVAQ